jgi:hypothetical protein
VVWHPKVPGHVFFLPADGSFTGDRPMTAKSLLRMFDRRPTAAEPLSVWDRLSSDGAAAIATLRREIPAAGVVDVLVDGASWTQAGGRSAQ